METNTRGMKVVRDEVVVAEIQTLIELKSDYKLIQPKALKIAMGYRGYNQSELSKNFKGLSQPALSRFFKGDRNVISEEKLKNIMEFLDFPFQFLYKKFDPIQTSKGYIT